MAKPHLASPNPLPQLVGYRELEEAFGLRRRHLEKMQRDGRFPKAIELSGNKRAWRLDVVQGWIRERQDCVAKLAGTQVDKLKPDEIPDALRSLAARHIASTHGHTIDPADVVSVLVKAKPEQVAAAQQAVADASDDFADALARLDVIRAWLVVAGLLPAIRPAADRFLETITGVKNTSSDEEARDLALDILDQALSGEFVGPK